MARMLDGLYGETDHCTCGGVVCGHGSPCGAKGELVYVTAIGVHPLTRVVCALCSENLLNTLSEDFVPWEGEENL